MSTRKFFYKKEIKLGSAGNSLVSFIEAYPEDFCNLSISEIAKKVYISSSSISKITRKLGFSNFKKMQHFVAADLKEKKGSKLIDNAISIKDIANNINYNYHQSIDRTLSDINLTNFRKIKKNIIEAKHIYTYGIGSSSLAAQEMSNNLNVLGHSSTKLNTIHAIFQNINPSISEDRILIIYSKSLISAEIITCRKILAKFGVEVIIFTGNQAIKKYSNETIVKFRTVEQSKRIAAMGSKISQLLLTDILINWIGKNKKNDMYKEFSKVWRK